MASKVLTETAFLPLMLWYADRSALVFSADFAFGDHFEPADKLSSLDALDKIGKT